MIIIKSPLGMAVIRNHLGMTVIRNHPGMTVIRNHLGMTVASHHGQMESEMRNQRKLSLHHPKVSSDSMIDCVIQYCTT